MNFSMTEHPGYYAIIPAKVRYDKSLTFMERILYGEITALTGKNGYCHASNSYFSNLYDVTVRTISAAISKLEKDGYIKTKILYVNNTKEIEKRIIYIDIPEEKNTPPIEKNFHMGYGKKFPEGIEKNFQENNININNTRYTHRETEITNTILKKYKDLNLPPYEYPPDPWKIMECFNQIGAEKLFEALEVMSRSDFVKTTLGVDAIFKIANLKKALNGTFRCPPPKESGKKKGQAPIDYSEAANSWDNYQPKGEQWKT